MDIIETIDIWTKLSKTNKPIVMYGTGDGADKLFSVFKNYDITVSDIFTSDEFFRGQEFRGFHVLKYSDIEKKYDDCIIVLAFAVFREDMLNRIKEIGNRFEVLIPETPVFGTDYFTLDTFKNNFKDIEKVYNLLADKESKKVFQDIINYRISGKPSYLYECESDREEVFKDIIKLGPLETYVDLGAYRGDTIEEFLSITNGDYKKIIAFEPDKKNFSKLEAFVRNLENVEIYNLASWSKSQVMSFSGGGGRNSTLSDGPDIVHAKDLDSVLQGDGATYVKMDVEGAEEETIKGIKFTLKTYKPKLSISAYHRTMDLLTLPILVKSINPDYKIFLRHHPYLPAWETNYYCI